METSALMNYGLMILIILIINWLLKDQIINFIRKITSSATQDTVEKLPIPRLQNINFVYRG
jgi:hypothetical protein